MKTRARIGVKTNYKLWGIIPIPANALIAVMYIDRQSFLNLQAGVGSVNAMLTAIGFTLASLVCEDSGV